MLGTFLNNKIPQVLITIVLFSEFVTKIYGFHLNDFYVSLSFFVKIIFVLFAFYMVIRNYKDELSKYLICLFIYLLFELIIYKFNVKEQVKIARLFQQNMNIKEKYFKSEP